MKKFIMALVPALMLMTSCNAQTKDGDVTVAEAKEMMQDDDVIVLDVRTPEEYEKGHIEGATLINFYSDDFEQKINELPKDKEYVVYCHSGNRSGQAVQKMEAAGFTKAHNMTGGWSSWSSNKK